jgi:hypothetical protein
MPRLTIKQYLEQRARLRASWQRRKAEPFASLSAGDQLYLYAYFAPTQEFTDEELLDHRSTITERYPALPQQAGRAYRRALPFLDAPGRPGPPVAEPKTRRGKKSRGAVVVNALPRSDTEIQKRLVRLLIRQARDDLGEQDQAA